MMTSPDSTLQPQLDGRTVREIVEHNHEMVSESWCRRIIRQVLQSLEVQYGMRMPHRLITPDTLLILDSGDPMLLPSSDEEPIPDESRATEARDLRDLAAVVHYAITLDLSPDTPLQGRPLPDYSPAFLAAIDRCLAPDEEARPQTIDAMRELLGIVVLGPPIPVPLSLLEDDAEPVDTPAPADLPPPANPAIAADPAATDTPSEPPHPKAASPIPMRPAAHVPFEPKQPTPAARPRRPRWPLIGGALLLLAAALAALSVLLRQNDAGSAQVVAPTPVLEDPQSVPNAPLVTLPAAQPEPAEQLQGPVIDESEPGTPTAPPPAADTAVPPTAVQLAPQGTPPEAAVAGTTYTLQVKPWGTIVVDGVERGASPPLRHITLPPGEHTIRIVNPGFPEHTVTVQSVPGRSGTIELDFTEETAP